MLGIIQYYACGPGRSSQGRIPAESWVAFAPYGKIKQEYSGTLWDGRLWSLSIRSKDPRNSKARTAATHEKKLKVL